MSETRDAELYETFVDWLAKPNDEWLTTLLMRTYGNASLEARNKVSVACDFALKDEVQAARAAAMKTCAKAQRRRFRKELVAALDAEHPEKSCHNNTCDIAVATKHNLHLYAAHILMGATECPLTEEAYIKYTSTFTHHYERDALLDEERQTLLAVPHVVCGACNAMVWEPDLKHGDHCGSCRSAIPPEHDEDEDKDEDDENDGDE